jgi:DNA-binding NarL/FixJ family response regulator
MLIALTLAELTGDEHWHQRALLHASHYPGCPIGTAAARRDDRIDPVYQSLTPLQRQIARAHWSGADAVALSAQFSRSRYTVDHQLSAIYAAFGVTSAGALRDEAARRGLM